MKPQVGDHEKLARVDEMPNGVPQHFSMAFPPPRQRALVDMEIEHVKRAKMAYDQKKIKSRFHGGSLSQKHSSDKG